MSTRVKMYGSSFGTGEGGDIFTLAGVMSGKSDFVEQARYIAEKMNMPVAEPYKPVPFAEEPTFENVENLTA